DPTRAKKVQHGGGVTQISGYVNKIARLGAAAQEGPSAPYPSDNYDVCHHSARRLRRVSAGKFDSMGAGQSEESLKKSIRPGCGTTSEVGVQGSRRRWLRAEITKHKAKQSD